MRVLRRRFNQRPKELTPLGVQPAGETLRVYAKRGAQATNEAKARSKRIRAALGLPPKGDEK